MYSKAKGFINDSLVISSIVGDHKTIMWGKLLLTKIAYLEGETKENESFLESVTNICKNIEFANTVFWEDALLWLADLLCSVSTVDLNDVFENNQNSNFDVHVYLKYLGLGRVKALGILTNALKSVTDESNTR